MKDVFIYVNGINTKPGDPAAWTDRAVTHTHINSNARAEKFEYFATGIFSRAHWQRERADNLYEDLIQPYAKTGQYNIHLVGHSNGCDVILKAIEGISDCVESVTLIAPATESDCEKNGLLAALEQRRINHVTVMLGGSYDRAVSGWAKLSQKALGWLAKGRYAYGTMGADGPNGLTSSDVRVSLIRKPLKHSAWFELPEWNTTMFTILSNIND